MENRTVSVIIPVYNVQAYLRQALDSVLAQTYRDLEVLCLNDGSTDGSLAIMAEYAAADPRIRVIDKENEGYGATCNRGLREATGYWVAIVEPDDWILPAMYDDMVRFAAIYETREAPVDIVKTPYWRVIDPDTPRQAIVNCTYRRLVDPPIQPFILEDAPDLIRHHPSIWSALYRRGFLDEHGIRFMELPGASWADNPFMAETLCQADRIVYLDEAYYCYREETEGKARQTALRNTLLPLERWQDIADVMERLGTDDPAVWKMHNQRGFTYLDGIVAYVPLARDDVLEATVRMCDRMDPKLVLSDPCIPPRYKRLFAKIRDLPEPKGPDVPYAAAMVRKTAHFMANAGPAYTLHMVRKVLGSRGKADWQER